MKFRLIIVSTIITTWLTTISCVQKSNDGQNRNIQLTDRLNYTIELKDLTNKPMKASFDIRLEKRISKEEIEKIANKIIRDNSGFQRYFIFYWLPDMEIGKGAWATSHYGVMGDGLSISIQGATEEEEKIMKSTSMPDGEIIGKWYDSRPYVERTIVFFRKGNQLSTRYIYSDGSFGDKILKQNGTKYIYPNERGEYFKIESDSSLGWYSQNGQFATLKKVD